MAGGWSNGEIEEGPVRLLVELPLLGFLTSFSPLAGFSSPASIRL